MIKGLGSVETLEKFNYYRLLAILRLYYSTGDIDREEVGMALNKIGECPENQ